MSSPEDQGPKDSSSAEEAGNEEEEQGGRPTATKVGVEGQEIPLQSLTPQQLSQLGQQIQVEIKALTQNLQQLSIAGDRFRASSECVQLLTKHNAREGGRKKLLVPLSQAVFIDGYCAKPHEVLVDVGTGYYCQKTADQATGFLDAKVDMIHTSASQVQTILKKKQEVLDECQEMMMRYQKQGLLQAQEQEQAQAA